MRLARLALLTILAWQIPALAAAAQAPEIIVRGDAARIEIERIVGADNLDTARLSPREVAEAIERIPRRRAPLDFWTAYRAHVQAWHNLADLTDAARGSRERSRIDAVAAAEEAIDTTFDEVERIARRYGARLPAPAWQRLPTV
ncbi:MAG TPA: hypothetical protein VEZ70_02465 [Allosphingosinicella sp.]|nr:hypothetical protein [Allosphingosinicella sp.]